MKKHYNPEWEITAGDVDLESLTAVFNWLSDTTDGIGRTIREVFGQNKALVAALKSASATERVLARYNYSDIKTVSVFRPGDIKTYMGEFADELEEHLRTLLTIDKRVFAPMNRFFANASTDPDYVSKLWFDKDLELADTKRIVKEIGKHFHGKFSSTGRADEAKYSDLYPSVKSFGDTFKQLQRMEDTARAFDLEKLRALEERTDKLVDEFIDAIDRGDVDKPNPKTLQRIVDVVGAAAKEVELVVALLYYANLSIQAYNDSAEKLYQDLR